MRINVEPVDARADQTELVWDRERTGTAMAGEVALPASATHNWTPERLLATAAGASLMVSFTRLASEAHLALLGYVARQQATLAGGVNPAGVQVTACITVPSEAAASEARIVWDRAVAQDPLVNILACPVVCEPRIIVVGDAAPLDEEC
jgi:organic hydroperoxide reductase OsmC/OhrA